MTVNDNEVLARFITSEGWFNQNQVKGDAFRPRKDHKVLKTSVTRHDGKDVKEIEKRAKIYEQLPGRKKPIVVFGWADVFSGAVRTISTIPALDIDPAPSLTDLYHANIVGWDLNEGQHLIQAEEIARQSNLVEIPVS